MSALSAKGKTPSLIHALVMFLVFWLPLLPST